MSLTGGFGLKSLFSLASLIGQDIVARSLSLTQATGLVALQMVTGARLKLGGGTLDYLESNGATVIATPGVFRAGAAQIWGDASTVFVQDSGSTSFLLINRGTGLITTQFGLAVTGGVSLLSYTDSSGTPGNATANTASGTSAIAAGASSCVISNTLVTANSRILISPRVRDATGLLPIVSARVAATSFTMSVTANCTATLTFDWVVIT